MLYSDTNRRHTLNLEFDRVPECKLRLIPVNLCHLGISVKGIRDHIICMLVCHNIKINLFGILGCKVMIASRKLDRLKETAEELRSQLPADSVAQLELIECNIRQEDQVICLPFIFGVRGSLCVDDFLILFSLENSSDIKLTKKSAQSDSLQTIGVIQCALLYD